METRCIGCMDCVVGCPQQAILPQAGGLYTDRGKCDNCGVCAAICPTTAREMTGKAYTPPQLLAEIEKDRVFYDQSAGGVTFSGGEPLAQGVFLLEMLRLCRQSGIHTTVDTCGFAGTDTLLKAAAYTDLFLYDLKLMDSALHRRYTGQPNETILENLQRLSQTGSRIWVRLPIIPGVNDNELHLAAVAGKLRQIGGIEQITLLPFHNLSGEKYRRMGMKNLHQDESNMDHAALAPLAAFLTQAGMPGVVWE